MRAVASIVCVLLAGVCIGPGASAETGTLRDPPTELWKKFPLQPAGSKPVKPSIERRTATQPDSAAKTPTTAAQRDRADGSGRSPTLLGAILAGALLTLALAAVAARRTGVRPFRPRAPAGPRKGENMTRKLRLLRGQDRVEAEGTAPSASPVAGPLDRLQSYGIEGSKAMESQSANPPAQGRPQTESGPGSYQALGEQVAAVLQSAQDAAAEMRRAAEEDADRTRRVAERAAEATTKEATQKAEEDRRAVDELRSEAEQQSEKIRAAANLHAEQSRKEAEEEAERTRAAAHAAAKQTEEAAIRRRATMLDEARSIQEWLEKAVLAFRDVTTRLEDVASGTPNPPEERAIDTALSDRIYAKTR